MIIERLAHEESIKIKSSATFPFFHSIVYELIYNSIDAKSSQIEIGINSKCFSIEITDNGK
jgi:DNA mismatch repair ATPase MutL